MKRTECLNAAAESVSTKATSYGKPEDNFSRIAKLWNAAKLGDFEATDVALAMILLKVARQLNSPKDDNWVDIAGYAACGAEVDESNPR